MLDDAAEFLGILILAKIEESKFEAPRINEKMYFCTSSVTIIFICGVFFDRSINTTSFNAHRQVVAWVDVRYPLLLVAFP